MSEDKDDKKVFEYRKKQATKIIEQYKDLMDKYDTVFQIDKLEEELKKALNETDDEKKKDTETKYLNMLEKRGKALEKKEEILDKIYALEKHLTEQVDGPEGQPVMNGHPSKRQAQKQR